MAISRIFQATAEYGNGSHLYEWTTASFGTIGGTVVHTGNASFVNASAVYYRKVISPTITQGRVGFWFYNTGVNSGDTPILFSFRRSSSHKIYVNCSATTVSLVINSVTVASVAIPVSWTQNDWHRIGFDFKINIAGWAVFYVDGIETLTFTGDTTGVGAYVDEFQVLSSALLNYWNINYIDDVYLDNTTGEITYVSPPDIRFAAIVPTGDGASSDFTGSDGDQINNYLQVDSEDFSASSTYIIANAAGLDDLYAHTAYSPPSGFGVSAVIYGGTLRRTDGAIATTGILTGKTGVNEYASAEITPNTSNAVFFDRRETAPDGGVWTTAKFNATEFGIRSAGVYA